jgi:hypothetical protein
MTAESLPLSTRKVQAQTRYGDEESEMILVTEKDIEPPMEDKMSPTNCHSPLPRQNSCMGGQPSLLR